MAHHTKDKGDLGVAKVHADLVSQGFTVLFPATEHAPFRSSREVRGPAFPGSVGGGHVAPAMLCNSAGNRPPGSFSPHFQARDPDCSCREHVRRHRRRVGPAGCETRRLGHHFQRRWESGWQTKFR
ncbi:MAG: group I intron-associated PD-(D/E)XK endonuclease [Mycobacterium sp.]